jgi:hypothetical protein
MFLLAWISSCVQGASQYTTTIQGLTTKQAAFTIEEYNKIMSLLEKENGNNQSFVGKHVSYDCTLLSLCLTIPYEICWIVNSGATDHITKSSPIHNEINHHDYMNLSNGD